MASPKSTSRPLYTPSSRREEISQNVWPDLGTGIHFPSHHQRFNAKTKLTATRLQEKVIDIEVLNATPSPTVDPSVHTILIGHSMGGIVAADTLLSLTSDLPIDSASSSQISSFMFPYVQGVLAFDTPYLGIAPGVVAHGAEGHYNTASEALTTLSGLTGGFWGGKATSGSAGSKEVKDKKEPVAALPAPEVPIPAWQKWGKIAAIAGTGAAIAAGGSFAYMKRDTITEGWSWVGSHLEFVGCLMRAEELKKRLAGVMTVNRELGIGFANLHTRLGQRAISKETGSVVGSVIGNQRTFCQLPNNKEGLKFWREAINDVAKDEILAHMSTLSFLKNVNCKFTNFISSRHVLPKG